jgi:signal transduction histidine kinase
MIPAKIMDVRTIQSLSHALQPMFAAVFLYHAYFVLRVSRTDLSIPYTNIVPMSLCAAAYYFSFEGYWLFSAPLGIRVVAHLLWIFGNLTVFFHVGALDAYFQTGSRWITRARWVFLSFAAFASFSLISLLVFDRMWLFSPEPMKVVPHVFHEAIRERIRNSFSMGPMISIQGLMIISTEVACYLYFLRRLITRKGDRWLIFGICLTFLAIINDVAASLWPQANMISILFVALLVDIVRLTLLIERANRERMLRLEHSMRLAQIGEMTTTVAHELVNPLTIIIGNAELGLNARSLEPATVQKILTKVHHSATRMISIVQGLRDHARHVESIIEPINVGQALRETAELFQATCIRNEIDLTLDIAPALPQIQGNRGRLQQVLLNLLQNANDATEGQNSRQIRISAANRGDSVLIKIQDNGCGIPSENMKKIFTPFFTTKPRGKGTGIGLSFVASQTKTMRGNIQVRSEPGGTEFELSFPSKAST